ncbi:hypothetical protein [Mesorhizobium sp.]|uniref:hypothetical protein n=1 Tax=Mesorhizobium sp. TaxID=1871066 RepID=UPI0025BF986E|nr:hypothetical protein [Mesorhizobium sp.]
MNADKSGDAAGCVDVDKRPQIASATRRLQIKPSHIVDERWRRFGPLFAQHALKHACDCRKIGTFQGANDAQARLPAPESLRFQTMARQGFQSAIAATVRSLQRCNPQLQSLRWSKGEL